MCGACVGITTATGSVPRRSTGSGWDSWGILTRQCSTGAGAIGTDTTGKILSWSRVMAKHRDLEQTGTGNVLDLRIARWRRDPFMAEMLEIIERVSGWSEEEKDIFVVRSRAYVTVVEREMAKEAKTKV